MGEHKRKNSGTLNKTEKPKGAPECYGKMFKENGQLTYGAMICDEEFCEFSEKCWESSKKQ